MSWLLSPIGRWFAGASMFVATFVAVYARGRADARQKIEGDAIRDAHRRTQDAIRAGDNVDARPDRLRDNDGHRRD
jgi:hypothetical protein